MMTWILIYGYIMLIRVFTLFLGYKRTSEHFTSDLFESSVLNYSALNILFSRSRFYTACIHFHVPTYLLLSLPFIPSCILVLHPLEFYLGQNKIYFVFICLKMSSFYRAQNFRLTLIFFQNIEDMPLFSGFHYCCLKPR